MSLGSQCCENPPLTKSSYGVGSVSEIGGLKAYVTGSSLSNFAIILISDVYGYEAPNLRNIADKVAKAGYYVVVPDFFYGDPFVADNPERSLVEWLKPHGPGEGFEAAKHVIADLRSKGNYAIGAAGFCWGGKVAVELAKFDYIQAAVLLHPSLAIVNDFKEVKAPIAVLGAEYDKISPPALLKQFDEVLSMKPEVDGYVKIFKGAVHGWAVRYKADNEKAVKAAEEAYHDMLHWFEKHVKKTKDVGSL